MRILLGIVTPAGLLSSMTCAGLMGLPLLPTSAVKLPLPEHCPDGLILELKRLEDTPLNKFWQADTYWPGPLQQFQFVVDCQVLPNLMNGVSLLTNPDLRPVFIRMMRMVTAPLDYGWAPKSAADAAKWRPTEWNSGVDNICNMSMDRRCKIFHVD